MAQFDVHRNRGASRARYPYLVVVQSEMLRAWRRRVVVPLAAGDPFPGVPDSRLNPVFVIDDRRYYLAAQEIANVPMEALGEVATNLKDHATIIIDAIDWMLNQGFG